MSALAPVPVRALANGSVAIAFLAVGWLAPERAASAVFADRLTVRLARGAAPEALRYLASHGEPEPRTLEATETIEAAVERHYGVMDPTLLALTLAENPELVGTDGVTIARALPLDITMPAGPRWNAGVAVVVPEGARIGELAQLYIGYEGPRTLGDIAAASGFSAQGLGSVRAGTEIQIPYQALPVSIMLRPEFRVKADEVAAGLVALDPEKVLLAEPEPEISPITLIDSAEFADAELTCAGPGEGTAWPFDGTPLQEILAANRGADGRGEIPVVAVADSGVDPDDTRFSFWLNPGEKNGQQGVNEDENEFFDDIVGADVASRDGDPEPDASARNKDHGTFVAGLVFGGTRSGTFWAPARDRIQLLAIKISGGQSARPETITGAAVLDAVRYANERAHVVNLSLEKYAEWGALRDQIALAPGTLFVVAAGNRGCDVDTKAAYPAVLGGVNARNVITVGAHDGRGGIASFSNQGATAVDLLAPGCDLESTVLGNTFLRSNGTSAAAPLVSFTAALLYDAGLRKPWEIKQRIVAATDPDPGLRGIVWSEGRLDVAAALDLRKDRIRTTDGRLLRGIVTNPGITIDGTPVLMRRVLKLVPLARDAAGQHARVALRTDQSLSFRESVTNANSLTIRTEAGTETLALFQVRDFVRRTYEPVN